MNETHKIIRTAVCLVIAMELCMCAMAEVYINTTPYYSDDSARAMLANRIKHIWRNITKTSYEHISTSVIDEMNGVYRYDCSGFIYEILLKEALPEHYDDIYAYWETHKTSINDTNGLPMNSIRPLAGHFYDYFRDDILKSADNLSASNAYWYVFQDINELQRGDLIVVRFHDEWRERYPYKTTGHMMISWTIGALDSFSNSVVRVFDSTEGPHTSTEDTRIQNDPPTTIDNGGIGSGLMEFKVSSNGKNRPYQYKWSTTSTSWYTLFDGGAGDDNYIRLEGIILARPIFTPYQVKPDLAIEQTSTADQGDGSTLVAITITTNYAASTYIVEFTDSLTPVWTDTGADPAGDVFSIPVSNSVPKRFFRLKKK